MKTTIPVLIGALWLVQSLFAGSTIQFQTRVFTVAETAGQVVLPVVRLNDLETEVAVEFYSVEATATAGQDFTAVSGTLSFAAGVTNQTITVPILNDALVESLERFQVVLTNATGGAVLGSMRIATVSIQDNDTGPYFASATQLVAEDAGSVQIQVNWVVTDTDEPQTVDYTTIDGSALAGADYEAASGTLVFEKPEQFKQIPVVILNDGVKDPDKSFQVQLSNASSVGLGNPSLTTVTIQDPTPLIYTQPTPASQSVSLGAVVKIQVSAKGARMQWQKRDGEGEFTDVAGATRQVLEWSSATVDLSGEYRFVVANSTGESVTSQIASVVVDPTFTKITDGPIVTDQEGSINFAWGDYDSDGFLDLYVVNSSLNAEPMVKNSLYRNLGDGTFSKITNATTTTLSRSFVATWADFDNDGDLDLFVGHAQARNNELFRNDGANLFTPVGNQTTGQPGLDGGNTWDATWGDYNNDGLVDLFVSRSSSQHDSLYQNEGNETFTKMTSDSVGAIVADGADSNAANWIDFDHDGDLDLYVCNDQGTNFVYRNDAGFFTRLSDGSVATESHSIVGAWGDYDNDGRVDVFVANRNTGGRQQPSSLHHNLGDGVFTNLAGSSVVTSVSAWQGAWGDYDNDGWLDLFILSSPYPQTNALFHNQGDGTFAPIDVGSPVRDGDRRIAAGWADYDNDGWLDLLIVDGDGQPRPNLLYRNNLGLTNNPNRWLKVRLTGVASNRKGIGATIRNQAAIRGADVWQLRDISGAAAFSGGQGLEAHFGLGDATKVDTLRIEWPSGIVQELKDVAVDQILSVVESQGLILPEPLSILSSDVDADGVFRATANCSVEGAVCVLESSSDLERWSKVQVGTSAGGTVELTDVHAAGSPARFYRVLVP